jgi:hypothetical protein
MQEKELKHTVEESEKSFAVRTYFFTFELQGELISLVEIVC